MTQPFETRGISDAFDVLAPDGSEIRLGPALKGGSMVHCSLPPGGVTRAVRHRTVEEIWYILQGQGQLWRKQGGHSQVVDLGPGTFATILLGTHFQFRNTGHEPLVLIICTMPPWPNADEAEFVEDYPEWR